MHKFNQVIFFALLLFVLAACGQTAEPTTSDDSNENNANTEETSSDLTLAEVFDKASEANNNLESFSIIMDMKQNMNIGDESTDMHSSITMDVVQEPLSLKQITSVDLGELGVQEMESYFTEDGFFLYEPTEDQWMKLPSELSEEVLQLSDSQMNVDDQLGQFKDFVDDFTFEQDDTHYILHLDAEGEKFNELFAQTMGDMMPEDMLGLEVDIFENINFNQVEYEIYIHKDTFYFEDMNVKMDYDMEIEGESFSLKQDIQSTYSNHNEIGEIIVPDDVIDQAVELDI